MSFSIILHFFLPVVFRNHSRHDQERAAGLDLHLAGQRARLRHQTDAQSGRAPVRDQRPGPLGHAPLAASDSTERTGAFGEHSARPARELWASDRFVALLMQVLVLFAVKGLGKLKRSNEKLAKEVIEQVSSPLRFFFTCSVRFQVYDNALVTAGLMRDSGDFVPRVNRILGELLTQTGGGSTILTP